MARKKGNQAKKDCSDAMNESNTTEVETSRTTELDTSNLPQLERPQPGYVDNKQVKTAVSALKDYIKKSKALKLSCAQRKNLLEAGEKDPGGLDKVLLEIVFKNVPANNKTLIHNVVLPHHWRLKLQPENYDIALFVKHIPPKTEAQKIQFKRDRDLDIENTHTYYEELFEEKLDKKWRERISRIISVKELATEFGTFSKLDRLSKTFDLFISDKQLMMNKMNPLPRRIGRRFWVREKKVPLMVKLDAKDLNERFQRAFSTEPLYILGKTSTETVQLGIMSQSVREITENIEVFLEKLYNLYDESVRFIRLKTSWGVPIPLYADLDPTSPKKIQAVRPMKQKVKPVEDDFDMLAGDRRISVHPNGTVNVLRAKRKRPLDESTPIMGKRLKRIEV